MRRSPLFVLVLGVIVAGLCGCRSKSSESFYSATTPQEFSYGGWGGDSYANGGIAKATGGHQPETNYGKGANPNAPGPINTSYDQPSKGSGQQPGEEPNTARAGYGQTNAPAFQPAAGDVSSASMRSTR